MTTLFRQRVRGPGAIVGRSVGCGYSSGHHGELLQGVFRDIEGTACRGLVTLPLRDVGTRATFHPMPDAEPDQLTVAPPGRRKALRVAVLTRDLCAGLTGHPRCGGHLELVTDIPVGLGMGSSTSDIVATVRAVSASAGVGLAPATIARLAVAAEGASDPLMLADRPVLFAQREGRVLETLGAVLPTTVVLGCLTGSGDPVDTLTLPPPEGRAGELETFETLRAVLRRAVLRRDVELLGRVSTASARHNQRVLAKGEFDVLHDVARTVGAAGVQVAHSGNVAGLLFDPARADLIRRLGSCVTALSSNDIAVTRVFLAGG